jgi:hypothetical protein
VANRTLLLRLLADLAGSFTELVVQLIRGLFSDNPRLLNIQPESRLRYSLFCRKGINPLRLDPLLALSGDRLDDTL